MIVGERRKEKHHSMVAISHHYRVFGRTSSWASLLLPVGTSHQCIFNHLCHNPSSSEEVLLDDDDASLDDLDEPDWNWVEEDLMVDDADDVPTVGGSKTSIDERVQSRGK
jgi:hypothetical protein